MYVQCHAADFREGIPEDDSPAPERTLRLRDPSMWGMLTSERREDLTLGMHRR